MTIQPVGVVAPTTSRPHQSRGDRDHPRPALHNGECGPSRTRDRGADGVPPTRPARRDTDRRPGPATGRAIMCPASKIAKHSPYGPGALLSRGEGRTALVERSYRAAWASRCVYPYRRRAVGGGGADGRNRRPGHRAPVPGTGFGGDPRRRLDVRAAGVARGRYLSVLGTARQAERAPTAARPEARDVGRRPMARTDVTPPTPAERFLVRSVASGFRSRTGPVPGRGRGSGDSTVDSSAGRPPPGRSLHCRPYRTLRRASRIEIERVHCRP